jgi:hypothetical protein
MQKTNPTWRKSSYSGADNANCLEVRDDTPGAVPVRDSKTPAGPVLNIPVNAWQTFINQTKQ